MTGNIPLAVICLILGGSGVLPALLVWGVLRGIRRLWNG